VIVKGRRTEIKREREEVGKAWKRWLDSVEKGKGGNRESYDCDRGE